MQPEKNNKSTDAILEFNDVVFKPVTSKRLRASDADHPIKGLTFSLPKGEHLGVIGKNGAGKSLLCRLAVGSLQPTTGNVTFRGNSRLLLSLSQFVHSLMSLREQLETICAWNGIVGREAKILSYEAMDFAGLRDFETRSMATLSSGERAKTLFSLALTLKVDLLVIDESLSVGDLEFRRRSRSLLEKFLHNGGSAIIVSHNMNSILRLCSSVMLLNSGRVQLVGDPAETIQAYRQEIFPAAHPNVTLSVKSIGEHSMDEIVETLIAFKIHGEQHVLDRYPVNERILNRMIKRFDGRYIDRLIELTTQTF